MHPLGQIVFGCLTIFVFWTIIQSLRNGRIYSKGIEFTLDGQPILFSLIFAVHLIIAAFCMWCALGYDPAAFFHAIGLAAI